jgi:hypothetical protein
VRHSNPQTLPTSPFRRGILYEKAVRVVGKGIDRTDKYADIEDLFYFSWSQFGYRPSGDVPWIFGDGRLGRIGRLKDTLGDLHAKYRSEKLLQSVRGGKSAIFHCLPESAAWSKSLIRNSRNMDFRLLTIEVNRRDLTIDGRSIAIDRIGDLTTNLWIENAKIVDVDGNTFFRTHSTAIMSLGALHQLLAGLQEQRLSAAAS